MLFIVICMLNIKGIPTEVIQGSYYSHKQAVIEQTKNPKSCSIQVIGKV
jgi:hypothetical protein